MTTLWTARESVWFYAADLRRCGGCSVACDVCLAVRCAPFTCLKTISPDVVEELLADRLPNATQVRSGERSAPLSAGVQADVRDADVTGRTLARCRIVNRPPTLSSYGRLRRPIPDPRPRAGDGGQLMAGTSGAGDPRRTAVIDGAIRGATDAVKLGRVVGIEEFGTPIAGRAHPHARRRRDPDPGPGRHPRACERTGSDGLGGLRHRDRRGCRGRGHDDHRHPAELAATDAHRGRAGDQEGGRPWPLPGGHRILGRGGAHESGRAVRSVRGRGVRRQVLSAGLGCARVPPLGAAELRQAMEIVARLDGLLLVHAEDPAGIYVTPTPMGCDYHAFVASRRDTAETSAIETVLAAAAVTDCRVHIVHLLPVRAAGGDSQSQGRRRAHHRRDSPALPDLRRRGDPGRAPQYKCCPPIRGAADQDALWAALLDGTIDIVVSDHLPSTPD